MHKYIEWLWVVFYSRVLNVIFSVSSMPIVNLKSFLCILGRYLKVWLKVPNSSQLDWLTLLPDNLEIKYPRLGLETEFVIMLINFPLGSAYYGIHYQSDKQSSRTVSSKTQRYNWTSFDGNIFICLFLSSKTDRIAVS